MNSLLGLSTIAVAGVGFTALGFYIHKDKHKGSRNFAAALIFIGAVLLSFTAFGQWLRALGAVGGVLALITLLFCCWVIWRDIKVDKRADGRAVAALFLLPFVFSVGLAQVQPTIVMTSDHIQTTFDTQQTGR